MKRNYSNLLRVMLIGILISQFSFSSFSSTNKADEDDKKNKISSNSGKNSATTKTTVFKVALYPNPATDVITIDIKTEVDDNLEIEILKFTGEPVMSFVNKGFVKSKSKYKVDISKLPKGIYTLKVKNSYVNEVQRFVIK